VSKPTRKARKAATIGNRVAPWRFLLFLAVLVAGYAAHRALLPTATWSDGAAMVFDGAAFVFLASLAPLLRHATPDVMRDHAARNDANRTLILLLTSFLTFVAMAAISGELKGASEGDPVSAVKLVVTLLLIWLFANSMYALHYAHAYYTQTDETEEDVGGIDFPGTKEPAYDDFLYFACTLGMTFQTSDTDITSSGIRRIVLLHSFFAFVFNIGVIAFTINVLGGS
jgi:uncharacterized membrane protein